MSAENQLYGLVAEFEEAHQLLAATKGAYAAGYRKMDAYSPFPIEGLAEALGHEKTAVPALVLIGGILGGTGGYFMQWFAAVVHYPINVGGRPLHSWPAYIPITFELTVLTAALFALIGMLALNRLPQPHHSIFNTPDFQRASQDRFFLCVEAVDARFEIARTKSFLEEFKPVNVAEVLK
jgi:hypothetical protein